MGLCSSSADQQAPPNRLNAAQTTKVTSLRLQNFFPPFSQNSIEQFCWALQKPECTVTELDCSDCKFSDSVFTIICRALFKTKIKILRCDGNSIGDESINALAAAWGKIKLHEFYCRNNRIGGECEMALAQALRKDTHLRVLDIQGNNLSTAGQFAIYEALKFHKKLQRLNLAGHQMNARVLQGMASFVASQRHAIELRIPSNLNEDQQQTMERALQAGHNFVKLVTS